MDSEDQTPLLSKAASIKKTEPTNEGYLFFCIPAHWVRHGPTALNNGPIATTILLLNSMIGSGILVQPYVFKESGILLAIFEYILVGIMTYTGVDLLIRSAARVEAFEYSELAVHAIGPKGELLVDISIIIGNFGALLSYIIIIGTLMEDVLISFLSPAWYTDSALWSALLVFIFVIPTCCIRNFGHLAYVSYLSIAAITGTMLLVLIGGPIDASNHSSDSINLASASGSFSTIGSIVFAFGYSSAVFHAYSALIPRAVTTFSAVAQLTTLLGVVMCFIVGIVGYLCFRDDTDTDILENFTGATGVFFKLIVIAHLIFYIPGDYVIMRYSIFKVFGGDALGSDDKTYFAVTFFTLAIATVLSCILQFFESSSDSLSFILDLTGGISGSLVSFILPGHIATIILADDKEMYTRGLVLAVVGCVIPVLVIASSLMKLF